MCRCRPELQLVWRTDNTEKWREQQKQAGSNMSFLRALFGSKETPKCGPSTVVYISIQIKIKK
jgi:hypothetical protein